MLDRWVDALPDAAIIVRGGASKDVGLLLGRLQDIQERTGEVVQSVFVAVPQPGEEFASCVQRACDDGDVPHSKVMTTTAGTLRSAGFVLSHSIAGGQASNHYHVHFQEPVTESLAETFWHCFSDPMPRPQSPLGGMSP